jgi:hypothetical protein
LQTLPSNKFTQQQLDVNRYGLSSQGGVPPDVEFEMAQFKQWCCTPVFLTRPAHMKFIASSTWACVENQVLRFLGFCKGVCGVQQPCLHHCLNANLVVGCLAFVQEREMSTSKQAAMAYNISRVCTYLQCTLQLSASDNQHITAYMCWLDRLAKQLDKQQPLPRATLQEQQEAGLWMQPLHLLQCITQVHQEAVLLVQQQQQQAVELPSQGLILQVMHAAMCCMVFGFVPPIRVSCVLSLQAPSYSGPCLWTDCHHKSLCRGNRLQWVRGSNHTALQIVLVHHKNSNKGHDREISYVLPYEVCVLLVWLLGLAREAMDAQDSPYMFCSPWGEPYNHTKFNKVWQEAVMPSGYSMPPQKGRPAFVTLLNDAARLGIVLQEEGNLTVRAAAAFAMGTSIRMWRSVYDKLAEQRAVQAGIDSMQYWRQRVLVEGWQGAGQVDWLSDYATDSDSDTKGGSSSEDEEIDLT